MPFLDWGRGRGGGGCQAAAHLEQSQDAGRLTVAAHVRGDGMRGVTQPRMGGALRGQTRAAGVGRGGGCAAQVARNDGQYRLWRQAPTCICHSRR